MQIIRHYRPTFNGVPVDVNQLASEIVELLDILKKDPPKTVLEIGTERGGTLYVWTTVAVQGAKIITVDLPNGYSDMIVPRYLSFGRPKKQAIHLVRNNSHSEETLNEVKNLLNGDEVDFLFIDADHSYKAAKQDFEMYSPLVKKGGIVGFHDLKPAQIVNAEFGVHILWEELIKKYPKNKAIIEDPKNQAGFGIGVLWI